MLPKARKFGDLPPNVHRLIASKMELRDATRLAAVSKTTKSATAANLATRAAQQVAAIRRAKAASVDLLAGKIYRHVVPLVRKVRRLNYVIPDSWIIDDDSQEWELERDPIEVHETTDAMKTRHVVVVSLGGYRTRDAGQPVSWLDITLRQVKQHRQDGMWTAFDDDDDVGILLRRKGQVWAASLPRTFSKPWYQGLTLVKAAVKVIDMLNQNPVRYDHSRRAGRRQSSLVPGKLAPFDVLRGSRDTRSVKQRAANAARHPSVAGVGF